MKIRGADVDERGCDAGEVEGGVDRLTASRLEVARHHDRPLGGARQETRSFVADTSSENVAPGLLDLLVGEILEVPARVWKGMFAGLLAYDDLDELGRLTTPTLLIWGDADDLVGRDAQGVLAARMQNVDLEVYPGVGHTPRWEDPSRFADDLAAFVERTRASIVDRRATVRRVNST